MASKSVKRISFYGPNEQYLELQAEAKQAGITLSKLICRKIKAVKAANLNNMK
jgi:hypothetical protein